MERRASRPSSLASGEGVLGSPCRGLGLPQVPGYVLVFIASVPAALAILKRSRESQGIADIQAENLSST